MDTHVIENFINNEDVFIPSMIATAIVVCVIARGFLTMISNASRERTRREIAAYIAEGSMSPEQGERLMNAGKRSRGCG